jgi:endogenous inhibitor of DNA gyrase (YacG/DUF329 family)
MTPYPESVDVLCPICGYAFVVYDVEEMHDKHHGVQCPRCQVKSTLGRLEMTNDPFGPVIGYLWTLYRVGGSLN